jgi:hypothetical protein
MASMNEKRVEQLGRAVSALQKDINKIKDILDMASVDAKADKYKDMPGVAGVFDGIGLVTEDGKKIEVPANYAAKSRLISGDKLKVVDEGGKQIFKQVGKVDRDKVTGVVSKKEGKWFVLTDLGSFRLADVAVDFNKVSFGDEIRVVVPIGGSDADFAALDKVLTQKRGPTEDSKESVRNISEGEKKVEPKPEPKPVAKPAPAAPKPAPRKVEKKAYAAPKPAPKPVPAAPKPAPRPAPATPKPAAVEPKKDVPVLDDDDLR